MLALPSNESSFHEDLAYEDLVYAKVFLVSFGCFANSLTYLKLEETPYFFLL